MHGKAFDLNSQVLYSSSNVAFNMGIVLAKVGNKAKAKQCFEAALTQSPDMKQAKQALSAL